MGEIWVTGDIHGDATRFSKENFPEQRNFYGNQNSNVVIILGDFGLIWDWHGETKQERFWLDWLEEKNYTTVFVDGNHENFNRLYQYPEKQWNGGKVHMIRPHVLHLMRGEIYDINGKSFFAFGGASSHDISDGILDPADYKNSHELNMACREKDDFGEYMYRIKGQSWWEQELPTDQKCSMGWIILLCITTKSIFCYRIRLVQVMLFCLGKDCTSRIFLQSISKKLSRKMKLASIYLDTCMTIFV